MDDFRNDSYSVDSNSSSDQVGFFLNNLGDYLPYTVFSALATIFGTFGNSFLYRINYSFTCLVISF